MRSSYGLDRSLTTASVASIRTISFEGQNAACVSKAMRNTQPLEAQINPLILEEKPTEHSKLNVDNDEDDRFVYVAAALSKDSYQTVHSANVDVKTAGTHS